MRREEGAINTRKIKNIGCRWKKFTENKNPWLAMVREANTTQYKVKQQIRSDVNLWKRVFVC